MLFVAAPMARSAWQSLEITSGRSELVSSAAFRRFARRCQMRFLDR